VKLQTALGAVAAALLSLALAAPATAASDLIAEVTSPAIAPAGPGDNGNGPPEEPGKPDNPGPDGFTPAGGNGKPESTHHRDMPELPENASPRAHAAVTAAYERFELIQERLDALRDLEPGADRNDALNELFGDFGDLMHSVSDAVHEADPQGDDDAEPEDEDGDLTLTSEEGEPDGDAGADDEGDADEDHSEDDADDDDDHDDKKDKDDDKDEEKDG